MDRELMMESYLAICVYVEFFNEQYSLLLARFERFKELREQSTYSLDTETYFDMIIVQLRALMLEKNSRDDQLACSNYTYKGVLKLKDSNKEDFAKFNSLLKTPMFKEESLKQCTVEEVIKVVANSSLCHTDNYNRVDGHRYALVSMYKKQLFDKNSYRNIDYIIDELKKIFKGGIEVKFL